MGEFMRQITSFARWMGDGIVHNNHTVARRSKRTGGESALLDIVEFFKAFARNQFVSRADLNVQQVGKSLGCNHLRRTHTKFRSHRLRDPFGF